MNTNQDATPKTKNDVNLIYYHTLNCHPFALEDNLWISKA